MSFLLRQSIEDIARYYRPYALRCYRDGASMMAPHTWQQFVMGHKGDIDATYAILKDLRAEKVEEARQFFRDVVEPKLSTQPTPGGLWEALADRDRRLQELEQQLAYVMLLLDQLTLGRAVATTATGPAAFALPPKQP